MHQKMAIMAEPRQILRIIISTNTIFMVYRKHPLVHNKANLAFNLLTCSFNGTSIRVCSCCPIGMEGTYKIFVAPRCLTGFCAEILLTFRKTEEPRLSIHLFTTLRTGYIFACSFRGKMTRI